MSGALLSRRALLKGLALGAVGASAGGALWYDVTSDSVTGDIRLEHVSVPVQDLPSAFDGYRLGFLTDIHYGMWIPDQWIHRSLELLSSAGAELLLLGGDFILVEDVSMWKTFGVVRNNEFIDLPGKVQSTALFERVDSILKAHHFPDGMLAVPGNHDHWNSTQALVEQIGRQSGAQLLINRYSAITRGEQRLTIFGVDDFLTGIPDLPPTARKRASEANVVLSHNPDYISALTRSPEYSFDLALCGHTHGGQIRLPGLGAIASQVSDPRFISGMTEIDAGLVYTSRGMGVVGLPFRINCPPEVTLVQLHRA